MQGIGQTLLEAAAGVTAATIVGTVWLNLKWLFHSKRSMERILSELEGMQLNVTTLFRLQGSQLMSLKATLEAQRDGQCNGNVEKAIESIEEAKKVYDEHLLAMLARQGEKDKKA